MLFPSTTGHKLRTLLFKWTRGLQMLMQRFTAHLPCIPPWRQGDHLHALREKWKREQTRLRSKLILHDDLERPVKSFSGPCSLSAMPTLVGGVDLSFFPDSEAVSKVCVKATRAISSTICIHSLLDVCLYAPMRAKRYIAMYQVLCIEFVSHV